MRTPPAAPPNPTVQRIRIWALCVGMFAGGTGAVWLSLAGLLGTVHGLARGAPLVVLSPVDARGLFAGVAMLALAPLCVPLRAEAAGPRRHRRQPPKRFDWTAALFMFAFVCLLLCLAAPPIVSIAIGEAASGRGYRLCPPPDDEHRPPMRWAAPPGRCPASWREAERMGAS